MKFPMDRPVKIVMLGAGGTGGYVAPYLFRLLHMLDRLHTFPDAMITVDVRTGKPVSTAFIENGMNVVLITSHRSNMLLGEGVKHRAPYERLEGALGIEMIRHIKDILKD